MIKKIAEFKDRLNQALSIKNMKPVELAAKTSISESTISQYRSGYAKPKEEKLAKISAALDVNPTWLMGLDVPMEQTVHVMESFDTPEQFEQYWRRHGGGHHELALSDKEYDLIVEYRAASEDDKRMIDRILEYSRKLSASKPVESPVLAASDIPKAFAAHKITKKSEKIIKARNKKA